MDLLNTPSRNLAIVLSSATILCTSCSSGDGENKEGDASAAGATSNGSGASGDGDGADGGTGTGATTSMNSGGASVSSGGTSGSGGDTSVEPPSPNLPLLVVATGDGIAVWENADEVVDGDPADFKIAVAGTVFELVATRQRLGVISTEGLFLFDELGELTASSTPAETIPSDVFSSEFSGYFHASVIDSEGDLWVTYDPGRAALFKGFNSLTSSSTPNAEFIHEWHQLASVSYHAKEDVLFGTQVSGAGIQIYKNAKTKSGSVSPDGALDDFSGWGSVISGGSLFVGGNEFAVWHDVTAASGPIAPSATQSAGGSVIDASADSVVLLASGSDEPLRFYGSAHALSDSTSPETLLLPGGADDLDLSSDGQTIAVLGEDVYLVEHGPSGLTLRATLPVEDAQQVLTLVE